MCLCLHLGGSQLNRGPQPGQEEETRLLFMKLRLSGHLRMDLLIGFSFPLFPCRCKKGGREHPSSSSPALKPQRQRAGWSPATLPTAALGSGGAGGLGPPPQAARAGRTGTGLAARSRSGEGWGSCWGRQYLCRSVRDCPRLSFNVGNVYLGREALNVHRHFEVLTQ